MIFWSSKTRLQKKIVLFCTTNSCLAKLVGPNRKKTHESKRCIMISSSNEAQEIRIKISLLPSNGMFLVFYAAEMLIRFEVKVYSP
jgi:hypothetical protein